MSILNSNTINNFVNNKRVRSVASKLTTPGAAISVVLLEGTVISGRTYQANKRGGNIEARERLTEESISAVIWLWGIKYTNKCLDFLIDKVGKIKEKTGIKDFSYDPGKDNVRKPFEYVTKGINNESTKKMISVLKFSKIVASAAMCVGFMGMVLPKLNQRVTQNMLEKQTQSKDKVSSTPIKIEPKKTNKMDINDFLVMARGSAGDPRMASSQQAHNLDMNESLTMSKGSAGDPQFKGGSFLETAAHYLENDNTTQLLTLDSGLFAGRAVNARNKYERREILFRDLVSSFFYMFSTKYIVEGLCALDGLKGKNTQLTPDAAHKVHEQISGTFAQNQGSMTKEEFKTKIFGEPQVNAEVLKEAGGLFKDDVATVAKMHEFIDLKVQDKSSATLLKEKALKLSKLQPNETPILTKSQLTNLFHNGAINEPEFINGVINDITDGKAMNRIKFVSQKDVDKHRENIVEYTNSILHYADKKGENAISKDLLNRLKNRNFVTKMGYWGAGMAVSGLFLSTVIPKVQYWMTQRSTGQNNFPGIQKYEKQK